MRDHFRGLCVPLVETALAIEIVLIRVGALPLVRNNPGSDHAEECEHEEDRLNALVQIVEFHVSNRSTPEPQELTHQEDHEYPRRCHPEQHGKPQAGGFPPGRVRILGHAQSAPSNGLAIMP